MTVININAIKRSSFCVTSSVRHLDFLSGQHFNVSLLSDGEDVGQNFGSGRHGHFELISVLLDLRDALDVFAFLNQVIRKT